MKEQKVLVLGASNNPERYSNMAQDLLGKMEYSVIPVNPREKKVAGLDCFSSIAEVSAMQIKIDTVTVYVSPDISNKLLSDLLALAPRRVIFNPGSENDQLMKALQNANILCEEACTLVLLRTGQF